MKLLEKFTDLEKALAYILEVNAAYTKQGAEKLAAEQLTLKLQLSLDDETKKNTTSAAAIVDLNNSKSTLEVSLKEAKDGLAEAIETVTELSTKLDLQEKHGSTGKVVLINKKNFTLIGDTFLYGGSVKTADQLSKDTVELARMLKIGSGALVELN